MLLGMSIFPKAVQFVLEAEGGYSNNPNDPGGETNYGISKKAYPDLDIKQLTRDRAISIYRRDYWLTCQCDKLPPALAIAVFGSAVNHGTHEAIKLLQQSLGVTTDGLIGPQTLRAAKTHNTPDMLTRLLSFRAGLYVDIVLRKPTQHIYYWGWLERLFTLQAFILGVTNVA